MAICSHAIVCKIIDGAGRCPDEDCQFFTKEVKPSASSNTSSPKFPNYGKIRKSLVAAHGKLNYRDRVIMSSTRDIIVGNFGR